MTDEPQIIRSIFSKKLLKNLIIVLIAAEIFVLILYFANSFYRNFFILPGVYHDQMWGLMLSTRVFKLMIAFAVPIMLAGMGGTFNERAGVINIGLEGIMIFGAWFAVYFTYITGDPYMGILGALIAGVVVSLLHAVFTITFKAEQIVTGVAINLLALGITEIFTEVVWGNPGRSDPVKKLKLINLYDLPVIGGLTDKFPNFIFPAILFLAILFTMMSLFLFFTKPGKSIRNVGSTENPSNLSSTRSVLYMLLAYLASLAIATFIVEPENLRFRNYFDVPVIGKILQYMPDPIEGLSGHNELVYIALFLVPICHVILFKTSLGLRIRVMGEHPGAAATAGISVTKYQYIAVVISGALAALGGAVMSIGFTSSYSTNMIGGRGFTALAAMIFGAWFIFGTAFAALFFGFFYSLSVKLGVGAVDGFTLPNPFLQMIPFIVAILALAGAVKGARPPASIGKSFDPES
jgi:ABC-type uncharacterized transport system permease subunit